MGGPYRFDPWTGHGFHGPDDFAIASRALQGCAAALIGPSQTSLLVSLFLGNERGKSAHHLPEMPAEGWD